MKTYLDFLEKQTERSKMNNSVEEPVRSISDSWLMRGIPVSDKLEPNKAPLHEASNNKMFMNHCFSMTSNLMTASIVETGYKS